MISIFKHINSDKEIIAGLQSGGVQRKMWEKKLFEQFFYLIKHGSHKYSLIEEDAASAYSDTIISVIDNVVNHKFQELSSLKSYTCQIFFNKCVDWVRKETTNKSRVNVTAAIDDLMYAMPDKTKNVIQEMMEKSQKSLLKQKLEEIGEKCKKLLLLFEDGYSDKDIAKTMLYNSAEVVKTSRLRCLDKLRDKIMSFNSQYE
jgi:RNA polymerase sigma factor (sigma-70 family)